MPSAPNSPTSNSSHGSRRSPRSPQHPVYVPQSPRPTDASVTAVSPPTTPAAFPLTLASNDNTTEEEEEPYVPVRPLPGEYPAISPNTAETIFALDPTLSATVRATAYGLATTVHERSQQYERQLRELREWLV
jgi:hypothetical protein